MHSNSISQPIDAWDCAQVKSWLNSKGVKKEMQTKFTDETIDGEALLWLSKEDIYKELTNNISITFGEKLKLWKYIEQLQQIHQSTNNEPSLPSNTSTPQLSTNNNNKYNKSSSITDETNTNNSQCNNTNNTNYKHIITDNNKPHIDESDATTESDSSSESNDNISNDSDESIISLGNNSKQISNKRNRNRKRKFISDESSSDSQCEYTNTKPLKIQKYNNEKLNIQNNKSKNNIKKNKSKRTNLKNKKKHKDIEKEKKEIRYSKNNSHDITNHSKRWTANELTKVWNFHYDNNWTNLQIAQHFKRTECGIMVQLDKMYKKKRAQVDLLNKKCFYNKNNNKQNKIDKKWDNKQQKWKSKDNNDNNDDSSSEDDDEDIPIRMRIPSHKNDIKTVGVPVNCCDYWDISCLGKGLKNENNILIKNTFSGYSSGFLKLIVSEGRHCWRFKFSCSENEAPFYIGLWKVGNIDIDEDIIQNYIGKFGHTAYVYDAYTGCVNVFEDDDKWSEDDTYGRKIKNDDVIEMYIDLNDDLLKIGFKKNEIDLGFSHEIVGNCVGKYRGVVSVYEKDTSVELIMYKRMENDDERNKMEIC